MDSLFYIGTDDGLVTARSSDGRSWQVENHGLKGWGVPGLAVNASTPNQVLAGTRGDGVWISDDFGQKWQKPNRGKRGGPAKVRCVTIAPDDPRRIYAGTEPIDVYVSEDLGESWQRLKSIWDVPSVPDVFYPNATVEPHVRQITIDPKNPNTMYAALQEGYMVKTTDRGETWRLLNKDFDRDVHAIVLHPEHTNRILIATGGGDSRRKQVSGRALYASDDGGENWEPAAMNITQDYSVPLTMSPKDHDVLYSAAANSQPGQWRRPSGAESTIIRSRDGGRNWERLERGLEDASKDFSDVIVVDDQQPERVYAAQRNGDFYFSEDGGDSWGKLELKVPGVAAMQLVHA
ncbi:MAG: hypothetical protein HW416_1490 [Chloroflexi bacterium]|nr:hypothetical protein [Chloroflexota bacterium]